MERKSSSGVGGLMGREREPEFSTPYFLVEEKRLLHNLEILKGYRSRRGVKFFWPRKLFLCFLPIRLSAGIWREPQPAVCMRQGWEKRNSEEKPMCFLRLTGKKNFRKSFPMQMILCLIHPGKSGSMDREPRRPANL